MPQQFLKQIEQARSRTRRHRWLTAACRTLAVIILTALVLIALDRTLGVADPVGRLVLALTFATLSLFLTYRCVTKVWQKKVTSLQVAHQVERQHPELRDLATSAWAFSQQSENDPTAGSESLRRATLLRAAAATNTIQWHQLFSRQPLQRAALALASVVLATTLLSFWLPQAMSTGLTRLLNPFSAAEWPRQHDLQFVAPPTLLAAGEDLLLELRDTQGPLPASVTIHYRTRRQNRWHHETQPLAITTPNAPLKTRRPDVQESLQYRATGGDHHTMPWHPLKVLPPPRIKSLQLTVHPPAYTDLPTIPWKNQTPIYAGSHLELRGQTDQPITHATLYSTSVNQQPAQVAPDQKTFRIDHADWQVSASDTYTLVLTTPAGLTYRVPNTLPLEVIVNHPPEVRFIEPTEDLFLLPNATVPLVVHAHDNLALRQIDLLYQRSDRPAPDPQRLPLWHAPDPPNEPTRQIQKTDAWQLANLSLPPGTTLDLRAQATDAQPSIGQTPRTLRLTIVTEQQLWQQITDRQTQIVETLTQLLRTQRQVQTTIADWKTLPEGSFENRKNAIHAALFRQRQIPHKLANGSTSLLQQLKNLLKTIDRNRIQRPETTERLQTTQSLLQGLVDQPLPAIDQHLSQLARLSNNAPTLPLLTNTTTLQTQVITTLRRTIDLLMQGNVLAHIERELTELRTDQQNLTTHCQTKIAPQILAANDSTDLPSLTLAVRRQRELARRLAVLTLSMSQKARRLANESPLLAARLSGTVSLARQLELQTTLQAAADQLTARRTGIATSQQQQAVTDFAKLLARLSGQDLQAALERFERLQAAEQKLQRLRQAVAQLHRELLKQTPEQLQKLAEQASKLAQQIQKLHLPQAASAIRQAAKQLAQNEPLKNKTKQQLDAAQEKLTTERRRQQVALARLQMAQLETKLTDLLERQKKIHQATIQLSETNRQDAAQQWADQQTDVRNKTLAEADHLTQFPVFAHLLKSAAATMQQIERRLQRTEFGPPTQVLTAQAIRQLTQLAEALRQEQKNLARRPNTNRAGGAPQPPDTPQSKTLQLALGQLRLLKSLQITLQQKTQTLETQQTTGQKPTFLAIELARQQKQLAELARQLASEKNEP